MPGKDKEKLTKPDKHDSDTSPLEKKPEDDTQKEGEVDHQQEKREYRPSETDDQDSDGSANAFDGK